MSDPVNLPKVGDVVQYSPEWLVVMGHTDAKNQELVVRNVYAGVEGLWCGPYWVLWFDSNGEEPWYEHLNWFEDKPAVIPVEVSA